MLAVALVALAGLLSYFKFRFFYYRFRQAEKNFPGPPLVPIVGNALSLLGDGHQNFKTTMDWVLKYRRSFRLWLGPELIIVVTQPKDLEAILGNMANITKAHSYGFFRPWIGNGLLTSSGEKWKVQRKVMTPAFHFNILNEFLDVFNSQAAALSTVLDNHVGKEHFDAKHVMKLYGTSIICETAMGVNINCLHEESDYVKAVIGISEVLYKRTLNPILHVDGIFSLTHLGKRQEKHLDTIQEFTRGVVQKRIIKRGIEKTRGREDTKNLESEDTGCKKRMAFLDIMLNLVDDGTITMTELMEQVETIMFTGHDTVSSALGFALYELAQNQDCQEKAYEEQVEIFGEDDRPATLHDLTNMKYLDMVIKETLRLYPAAPIIGRQASEDIKLDESTTILKGTHISMPLIYTHRHPDFWDNPEKFNPENFTQEACVKRHPFAFVPFSAGPRNCIGQRFAQMMMKCTLCHILRKFKLLPPKNNVRMRLSMNFILESSTGFPIVLEKR